MSGRVLSVQSHVVHGHVGNKSAIFPMQLLGLDVDPVRAAGPDAASGLLTRSTELSPRTGCGRPAASSAAAGEAALRRHNCLVWLLTLSNAQRRCFLLTSGRSAPCAQINSVQFSNHTGYAGGFTGDRLTGEQLATLVRRAEHSPRVTAA